MTTPTTPAAPAAPTTIKNGTTPAAPQQPITPPAPAESPELKTWQERATKAEQLAAQKTREEIVNRRKWEGEKKTFAEKLKMADDHAKLMREKDINPTAAAKRLWGDKWHEHLNTVAANGGAPTAESVQLEIERAEERATQREQQRQEQAQQQMREAAQKRVEQQMRAFNANAVEYAKGDGNEYLVQQLGSPERVAGALVARIRGVHDETVQRDPETGEVLKAGRILTFKEAADALEADLVAIAERTADNPKYQEKLRAKLTPGKTPGTVPPVVKSSPVSSQGSQSSQSSSQPRRTLGNDLTGSTPPAPKQQRSEDERLKASLAKYHELAKTKA